ncbi:MAG: hypothetical protein WHS86_14475 [Desulfosoma sp.]
MTPVQTEKIDQAAQKIGANIDQMSQKASRRLGKWVDANVLYGISWLKLMICAGLLFGVVVFERLVRALLRRRLQRLEAAGEKDGWLSLTLETLHKPLTLLIWVYGVYAALSPLFGHFQSPDGTNLVHTVASRAADVGGTIVLIWVIYRLATVVDVRTKRWAATTESTYDTPPEKVELAVEILQEILENHEGMHPDFPPRVVFNGFNDWSLNIMVIAWYHPPEYWAYQAWLQKTCLAILKAFNEEGIDFAFPSRTIYLANDDRRQLKLRMLQGETS